MCLMFLLTGCTGSVRSDRAGLQTRPLTGAQREAQFVLLLVVHRDDNQDRVVAVEREARRGRPPFERRRLRDGAIPEVTVAALVTPLGVVVLVRLGLLVNKNLVQLPVILLVILLVRCVIDNDRELIVQWFAFRLLRTRRRW